MRYHATGILHHRGPHGGHAVCDEIGHFRRVLLVGGNGLRVGRRLDNHHALLGGLDRRLDLLVVLEYRMQSIALDGQAWVVPDIDPLTHGDDVVFEELSDAWVIRLRHGPDPIGDIRHRPRDASVVDEQVVDVAHLRNRCGIVAHHAGTHARCTRAIRS